MTKTLEERAKIGARKRADRESENYPYDSFDIFEAYQAGYEDAGEKELQAVLDRAKAYEMRVENIRPFVYLEDLEFIIKDGMK